MKNNYWLDLVSRIKAGDEEAARQMPEQMQRCLRIMVRQELRRPMNHTSLGRLSGELARHYDATGAAARTGSATGLIEQVSQLLADEVSERLQSAEALQTALV